VDLSELLTERDIQMILIYNSSLKVAYEWVREIKTRDRSKGFAYIVDDTTQGIRYTPKLVSNRHLRFHRNATNGYRTHI